MSDQPRPTADTDARENIHEQPEAAPHTGGEAADALAERFGARAWHSHGQAVVFVDRERWHDVAQHLRDEERFLQCVDVTAVDHLADVMRAPLPGGVAPQRFEVVANFLSYSRNRRIRAIVQVPADDPTIASLTDLYPGVNFAEREVYDLFGITFTDHPALTRILMPDDWVGYPLRKDDPPAAVPVTFKGDPLPR